jgi:hypothetical protein
MLRTGGRIKLGTIQDGPKPMFCRFWPSLGLAFFFLATPLFAQGWPVPPASYPNAPAASEVTRLPTTGARPGVRETEPPSPHAQPAQDARFAEFHCADGGCYEVGWNQGPFFQYDYLYWSISAPNTTVIGDEGSERWITTTDGVTFYHENSLDTSWLRSEFSSGNRFEFGYQQSGAGLFVSVLKTHQVQSLTTHGVDFVPQDPYRMLAGYADGNGDGVDDDINNNNIYGRYGEDLGTSDGATPPSYGLPYDGVVDTPAPIDTGDQVMWLVTYENVTVSNETELLGFEVMATHRDASYMVQNGLTWLYGIRYLQFNESFGLQGSGGFLDATSVSVDVENDLVGPQIGLRWNHEYGYLTLNAEGRFTAAANFQRADMVGSLATTQEPGGQNKPASLNALGFNAAIEDTAFSPIGEFRVETICRINPWIGFRLGYTGMVMGGVSRASEKVTYALPAFRLGSNGSREVIYAGGVTLGVELNR